MTAISPLQYCAVGFIITRTRTAHASSLRVYPFHEAGGGASAHVSIHTYTYTYTKRVDNEDGESKVAISQGAKEAGAAGQEGEDSRPFL